MWPRILMLAFLLAASSLSSATAQVRARPVEGGPDEFAAKVVERIEKGDLEGLARAIGIAIGMDTSDGQLENQIKQIGFVGTPMFFERVHDQALGTSLRQMIYYAPFRNERLQINFIFFNFVFMRTTEGWFLTHFRFDRNLNHLVPPGWITTK
jgi:hypothetical protein